MNKLDKSMVGMWFLPNIPGEKLSGTLDIDDMGRCKLKIAHDFGAIEDISKSDRIEVINGFMANGKKVTLIDCLRINQQWSFPGFPVTVYSSRIAIIGECYKSDEDVNISEITASYSYLNYWINCRPFTILSNDNKKEIYMKQLFPIY